MKKIIFIFSLFIALCFPIMTKAIATNSLYKSIKVYFFYEDNCKECNEAEDWLKENKNIGIEYKKVEENKDLIKKIKDLLNIKKDNKPLIIIGTKYYIGFNNKIKNNIKEVIETYETNNDYCDVVSKIENNLDTKECIKQDSNTNKSNKFPMFLKIILIFIRIILVVSIIFFIKKKNNK